ncbi:15-hydroxyprostaglandin dehydrogenase (NAD(+)) [Lecanosticta acicola]|uniref:15-hydroxyprostaglandin dehydrogenase (NAD(+)) n=1 Tax=Lecanosticta acicola TaxID=111012 RepID=A0AAI9EET0_9PEZI|nr:15-hydroxyprostaglandin dehydrogenase (NAD(+)) [Lecanosticta acicola]
MGSIDNRAHGTSTGKVAIVTGATSGMGRDLAIHLHKNGWRVAAVGRNETAGKKLIVEIGDENARFFQADVASYESQASMFRAVWEAWGRLDLLCANAGVVDKSSIYIYGWRDKDVYDIPPRPDLSCTDIDYKGVIYGTQLATHFMRHNDPTPGGKIIVNASIGGIFPHRAYPEYCGAKAAVVQFVRGVAPLLRTKENIYINAVLPGAVETPIVPPEMIAAVSPECLTPISTIIDAHNKFINDDTGMSGQALEGSSDRLVFYDMPPFGNGYKTERAVTVWEPLFRAMHGEDSQLEDAIP